MATKVYLCGGINSLTDEQANKWRQEAKVLLPGFEILDPMVRDYRGKEDETVDQIVQGDLQDVGKCHVMLVNATRPSWGTAMEVVYGRIMHKRIIAFVEPGKPVSPWLRHHADAITDGIVEAISFITEKR